MGAQLPTCFIMIRMAYERYVVVCKPVEADTILRLGKRAKVYAHLTTMSIMAIAFFLLDAFKPDFYASTDYPSSNIPKTQVFASFRKLLPPPKVLKRETLVEPKWISFRRISCWKTKNQYKIPCWKMKVLDKFLGEKWKSYKNSLKDLRGNCKVLGGYPFASTREITERSFMRKIIHSLYSAQTLNFQLTKFHIQISTQRNQIINTFIENWDAFWCFSLNNFTTFRKSKKTKSWSE